MVALIGLALIGPLAAGRAHAGDCSASWRSRVLSLPAVAALLIRLVDDTPPLDPARAVSAQAIVILGGGVRTASARIRRRHRGAARRSSASVMALACARDRQTPGVASAASRPATAHETEARLMKRCC